MCKRTRADISRICVLLLLFAQQAARAEVTVEPETLPIWNIAPYELSHHDLHLAEGQAFQPAFDLTSGSGNLVEWRLDRNAARSAGWDARSLMLEEEAADPAWWISRKIIMRDTSGNQQGFWWNHLNDSRKAQLDPVNARLTGAGDSPVLNYLRGDRSGEVAGGYRMRESLLGPIISSNPVFVGAPEESYDDYPLLMADYAEFRRSNAGRDTRLYAGANDGMLHAFDATDGREVWAYVPSMIDYAKLAGLARMPYEHAFFVDGELVAADAVAGGEWRTLLAGGLGAGGKGLFILDVTDPGLADPALDRKILAEFDGSDPDLGYIHGPVSIVLLEDDDWYLVTGNGFLPESGKAALYLFPLADLANSTPLRIMVPEQQAGGLSPPAVIDTDGNGRADTAYAGDLGGNLWKFDLAARSVESYPLYAAGQKQPVTTRPEVAAHPDGGFMVYVGTGSLLSDEDAAGTDPQSILAIHDFPGRSRTVVESDLLPSGNLALDEVLAHGRRLRVGGAQARMNLRKGWKVDLPGAGERVLKAPLLRAGRVQFISTLAGSKDGVRVPASWYMELDWLSGGHPGHAISDFNGDGVLTDEDMVSIDGTMIPAVGEYLGAGLFSRVRLAHTASGSDVAFINGLSPGHAGTDVPGGRRFDLDTDIIDHDGFGGETGRHTHAIDASRPADREIDYFGNRLALNGHTAVDLALSAHLADDEFFILTLANADLSPAAVLTIRVGGTERQWKVLDYQKLVQKRLQDYDGTQNLLDHFRDPGGYPLVYAKPGGSPQEAVLESLKITIGSDAWSTGGLLGTNPECVNTDPHAVSPLRWRGGALTLHLLGGESLKSVNWRDGERSWTEQAPADLDSSAGGFGGVHANPANPDGFLYESTIFWHYPADACYGEAGWGLAAMGATGAVTESMVTSMLVDIRHLSSIDRIMQAIAGLNELVCDGGKGFLCSGEPAYLEGRKLLEESLDFQALEEVALMHDGVLAIDETYRLDASGTDSNLARTIGPKASPVIDGLDRHRSWIDVEF